MLARVIFIEVSRARLQDKLAAGGHGVTGVERKIEDCGGELIGIDGGDAGFAFKHRFDFDLLPERRPQQPGGVDDQRVDVGLPRLQRLFAGKCQKMLGKVRAA